MAQYIVQQNVYRPKPTINTSIQPLTQPSISPSTLHSLDVKQRHRHFHLCLYHPYIHPSKVPFNHSLSSIHLPSIGPSVPTFTSIETAHTDRDSFFCHCWCVIAMWDQPQKLWMEVNRVIVWEDWCLFKKIMLRDCWNSCHSPHFTPPCLHKDPQICNKHLVATNHQHLWRVGM